MKKLFAIVLFLSAASSFAAVDAFLKIDTLKTQSSDAAHPGWLGVSRFSWGAAPAGTAGCASSEIRFTVPEGTGIYYFFEHAQQGHKLIPEATLDSMGVRHQLQNVTVRTVQGNVVTLHFEHCLTHPAPIVVATGKIANTTLAPQHPVVTTTAGIHLNTSLGTLNAQMTLDGGVVQHFNLVSLRVTGFTATMTLRDESATFFQNAARSRTKNTKVVVRKDAMTFTFSNCVISSYSHGTDGTDTVGLNFSIYSGPAGGWTP